MSVEALLVSAAVKAALLLGTALVGVAFARRLSAALRHAILLAGLIGALLIPVLSAALPTFSPFSIPFRPFAGNPEARRLADGAIRFLLVRTDPESVLPLRVSRPEERRGRTAILALWIAGVAIGLFRIGADLAAARRVLSRATLRGSCGRGVPLFESTEITGPAAVGLLRPAIMIPAARTYRGESLRLVIAHELAHVERRDCLTQLIVRLACAVYWFNPLAWYVAGRIALERERACDDRVLNTGVDPVGYSRLLVMVARRQGGRVPRLHAVASMAQPAWLERRIMCILDPGTRHGPLSSRAMAAVVLASGLLVAPLATLGVHDRLPATAGLDPWFEPQSERVPGVRETGGTAVVGAPGTSDGELITVLYRAAGSMSRSDYDLVPDRARWALAQAVGGELIAPLIDALGHPDWRVRGYAAWALGYSGDSRAVEPLIRLLDHSVWRLRAVAAAALRQLGDPRAEAAMTAALKDPAWQVRIEAVAFLGAIDSDLHSRQLEPLRNDPHIAVRLAADEALTSVP